MPSEDSQLSQAQQEARAGNYRKARELLLPLKSEKAKKWLHQVNEKIAAQAVTVATEEKPKAIDLPAAIAEGIKQAETAKQQAKAKQQGYVILTSIALMFACCGWISYIGRPNPVENVIRMCALVRSVNLQCDADTILRDYPEEVAYCQAMYGNFVDTEELKFTWQNCMRSRGVVFWPNP